MERVTKPALAYIDGGTFSQTRIYVLGKRQHLKNPLLAEPRGTQAHRKDDGKFIYSNGGIEFIKGPCQVYYSTPDKTGRDPRASRTVPSLCVYDPGDPILWKTAGELMDEAGDRRSKVFSATTWQQMPQIILPEKFSEKLTVGPQEARPIIAEALCLYAYSLVDAIDIAAFYINDSSTTIEYSSGFIADAIVRNEYLEKQGRFH